MHKLLFKSLSIDQPAGQYRTSIMFTLDKPQEYGAKGLGGLLIDVIGEPGDMAVLSQVGYKMARGQPLNENEERVYELIKPIGRMQSKLARDEAITSQEMELFRKIAHIYPEASDVPELMTNFFREFKGKFNAMKDSKSIDYIDLAADALYNISNIHPFVDGNGRIGRMMMNQILITGGICPISFDCEAEYLAALRARDDGDSELLKNLIRSQVTKQQELLA